MYQSVPDKNNVYKWVLVKDEKDKNLGMILLIYFKILILILIITQRL